MEILGLVGYGRAEQGEDSIAGGLNYVAVVVMDRVDHQAQSRIDDRARLFWIQLLHQIHRTLDVGEEGGHRLALLVGDVSQGPFGCYANRAIGSSAVSRRSGAGRRLGLERVAALSTEFEGWRILEPTMGAAAGEGRGAIAAKFHAVGILKSTF